MPTILIAEHDGADLTSVSKLIRTAGHRVITAHTVDQADAALAFSRPALLLASVQLGGENGLQLLLRSRVTHPRMATIVTSELSDAFLESEARQYGASAYLVKPLAAQELLARVSETLAGVGRPRRWVRKAIEPGTEGYIGGRRCEVVDISAGGLRLELPNETVDGLPTRFAMRLPALDATVQVELVWTARINPSGPVSAGVTLAPASVEATRAWREKVSQIPSHAGA